MKYIKLFEEVKYNYVDYSLIQDIKEMALEYIDNGLTLRVEGEDNTIGYCDYILIFNHEINKEKVYGNIRNLKLNYYIFLFNSNIDSRYNFYENETEELVDRIKNAYPQYNIRVAYFITKNKLEI